MISFYINILLSGGIFENWFRSSSRACIQACAQRVFTCLKRKRNILKKMYNALFHQNYSNGGSFSTRVKVAQSFIQSIEVENSRPNPSISGKGSGADWFHVASKITSNCGQKGIYVGRSAIIAQLEIEKTGWKVWINEAFFEKQIRNGYLRIRRHWWRNFRIRQIRRDKHCKLRPHFCKQHNWFHDRHNYTLPITKNMYLLERYKKGKVTMFLSYCFGADCNISLWRFDG